MSDERSELRIMLLRRVLDEWRRRHRERIDAFLLEVSGAPVQLHAEHWPESLERLPHIVDLCLMQIGRPALPHSRDCAAALGISSQAYNRNWRHVAEWVHKDLAQVLLILKQEARTQSPETCRFSHEGGTLRPSEKSN